MYRNWTALIKPSRVDFVGGGESRHKATVVVEPLERGFGTTLGNALRRVLISSLQGAAISSVKIDGVSHEVVTVPGVVEDVTGIILNLKGVIIRTDSSEPQTMTLTAKKSGVVTAGDIDCGQGVQILNQDHPIATITKGGKLEMVMTVTTGKGYVPAMSVPDGQSVDIADIPVDCSYGPVKYASYQVSNARIGQQTDYDKLVFDIETNGVISPEGALEAAARILQDQLSVFVNFADAAVIEEHVAPAVPKWNPYLFRKLDEIDFSVRPANSLKDDGIVYIGDLVQKSASDLLKIPRLGRKSLNEINEVLNGMELTLGMQLEGWPPDDVEEIARRLDNGGL
ncbi:MAG: DNA-directed RNA polymerase subunit alpha [Magnetococcales bacterium]|nr:DNA-directed RNA polymerase subunit alpha [Magnetococcales bacterium]